MLQREYKSPRQNFIDQLNGLLNQLNVDIDKPTLNEIIIEFSLICHNLKFSNNFSGLHSYNFEPTEDVLRTLTANIRAAIACVNGRSLNIPQNIVQVTNHNFQEQNQSVEINLMESLRKCLTGEQYDEIKTMIEQKKDKKSIAEKLKEFGSNVLAGVLSTLISSYINGATL